MDSSKSNIVNRRLFATVPLWWLEKSKGTLTLRLYLAIVCEAAMNPGPVSITNQFLRKHGLTFTNRSNARRAVKQLQKMGLVMPIPSNGYRAVTVGLPHKAPARLFTTQVADEQIV
jgi:hypothetical protein